VESLDRKKIFIVVLSLVVVAAIILYFRKRSSSVSKRKIDKSAIPAEVLQKFIETHTEELDKAESFEGEGGNNFPLVLGSEGDNVSKLQMALGLKDTGKLDKRTMSAYQEIMSDMGVEDLSKVSESALVLIEAYSGEKNPTDFTEGDVLISNIPKLVCERVNVKRNQKGDIIKLQPTKDFKVFEKSASIGVLAKKINNDQGIVKNDLGDFLLVHFNSVKKK